MSVLYKPHKSGKTLLIGGQSSVPSGGGLVGPFPRYSINREELSTPDGTYMGTKFTIDITGTATLNPNDTQDITVKGQRQSRVQGEALTALQFDRDTFPTQGNGLLEISPYGGQPNTISFNDARLLSISLPEQTEEEAGVQRLEYTFSFEAYKDTSSNTNTGTTGSPSEPSYKLSSAEESWDLSVNDGELFFDDNDPAGSLHKTYTLTHTLSATGLKKYSAQSTMATDGEAWRQAQKWVQSRLDTNTSIRDAIDTDLMNDSSFWITKFIPINMDGNTNISVGPDLKGGDPSYRGYNHVRQINSDLGAGTYGVTETWLISAQDITASHQIETSIDDQKGAFITVSISATFQGLDSNNATDTAVNKYANALTSYSAMESNFYALAVAAYNEWGGGTASGLTNRKITESYGQNKVAGTITYSVSFNDAPIEVANAISEDITVNYDNYEGLNKVIAKIPIIGKADGPIIQDMTTTTIKSTSASIDLVMDRDNRTNPPRSAATTALDSYKPTQTSYQQAKTESWNPKTGAYNLQISWEYI